MIAAPPPVHVRPAPAWVTIRRGPSQPYLLSSSVVAVTAPDARTQRPFAPFTSFTRLRPRGIIVWITNEGRGSTTGGRWPLRLSTFRVDRGWEGQPAANIQQRLRFATVGGWKIDARVYFATQHPDRALLAQAQAELDRLRLPPAR